LSILEKCSLHKKSKNLQTTQTTKPGEQGQYANSPLSQISSLIAALQGVSGGTTGGTTGSSSNLANSILGLPAAAVNSIKDLLGTFGISFAEGGQVQGYADGGAVDSAPSSMTQIPSEIADRINQIKQLSSQQNQSQAMDELGTASLPNQKINDWSQKWNSQYDQHFG